MYNWDSEAWIKMFEDFLKSKHNKNVQDINFWLVTEDLFDKEGKRYSQVFPRFAINFK